MQFTMRLLAILCTIYFIQLINCQEDIVVDGYNFKITYKFLKHLKNVMVKNKPEPITTSDNVKYPPAVITQETTSKFPFSSITTPKLEYGVPYTEKVITYSPKIEAVTTTQRTTTNLPITSSTSAKTDYGVPSTEKVITYSPPVDVNKSPSGPKISWTYTNYFGKTTTNLKSPLEESSSKTNNAPVIPIQSTTTAEVRTGTQPPIEWNFSNYIAKLAEIVQSSSQKPIPTTSRSASSTTTVINTTSAVPISWNFSQKFTKSPDIVKMPLEKSNNIIGPISQPTSTVATQVKTTSNPTPVLWNFTNVVKKTGDDTMIPDDLSNLTTPPTTILEEKYIRFASIPEERLVPATEISTNTEMNTSSAAPISWNFSQKFSKSPDTVEMPLEESNKIVAPLIQPTSTVVPQVKTTSNSTPVLWTFTNVVEKSGYDTMISAKKFTPHKSVFEEKYINLFATSEITPISWSTVPGTKTVENSSERPSTTTEKSTPKSPSTSNAVAWNFSNYFPKSDSSTEEPSTSTNPVSSSPSAVAQEKYIHFLSIPEDPLIPVAKIPTVNKLEKLLDKNETTEINTNILPQLRILAPVIFPISTIFKTTSDTNAYKDISSPAVTANVKSPLENIPQEKNSLSTTQKNEMSNKTDQLEQFAVLRSLFPIYFKLSKTLDSTTTKADEKKKEESTTQDAKSNNPINFSSVSYEIPLGNSFINFHQEKGLYKFPKFEFKPIERRYLTSADILNKPWVSKYSVKF